jgi:hypothetical protein
MCGGFVAIASDGTASARQPIKQRAQTQLAYNFGRLLSYTALGAVAGALGQALDLAGAAAGLGRVAALLAGSSMLLWGLGALLETQGVRLLRVRAVLPRRLTAWFAALAKRPPLWRALVLGLSTTLLPCGWLYAFALSAAGTAIPLQGALLMGAFWVGNVPILLGLGVVFSSLLRRVRRHVPVFSALTILCVGLFTVISRANLPAFALRSVTSAAAGSGEGGKLPHVGHEPACHKVQR